MTTTTAPSTIHITFGPIGEPAPQPGEKLTRAREKRIGDATPYPLAVLVPAHTRSSRVATEAYLAGYIACHVRMWMPTDRYTVVVKREPNGTDVVELTEHGGTIILGRGVLG